MSPSMQTARLIKVGQPLEVGTVDKPKPGLKEVLVKVEYCSLVPNTQNIVKGKGGPLDMPLPIGQGFGLDVSGVIEAVGDHVLDVKIGERVYVNPYLTCNTCFHCRSARQDLCIHGILRAYFGVGPASKEHLAHYPTGGLSEYIISPEEKVARLPESVDFAVAARLGYIGTSFGGLKKGKLAAGQTLLIHGVTGTLGFAAVAIALGLGASKIIGIGRNKERLQQVADLSPVAGRVITVSSEEEDDLPAFVKKHTGGLGVDVMYDCLGVGGDANTTEKLINGCIKRGGIAILAAGGADGQVARSYMEWMMNEVTLLGTLWFTDAEVDELITLIAAKVIDFSFLQTKEFALKDVNEALTFVGDRPGGAINVVVKP